VCARAVSAVGGAAPCVGPRAGRVCRARTLCLGPSQRGKASGAALAAATNGDVLTGAIAGGAAGALCDEITNICR
jgi:hypothetical protein